MADNIESLTERLEQLERGSLKLSEQMSTLSGSVQSFSNALPHAKNTVDGLVGSLGKLYEVTLKTQRSMELTGSSVQQYQQSLDRLHSSTNLSVESSARLFSTLEKGFVGLRNADSLSNFIENVHELGLTAENTEEILNSASRAQSKYVDIIDRINNGGGLSISERLSLDPQVAKNMDQLALSMKGVMQANPEQNEFMTSMQNIKKIVEDLQVTTQKALTPLLQGFEKVAGFVSSTFSPIVKTLGALLGNNTFGPALSGLMAIGITMGTVKGASIALRNTFKLQSDSMKENAVSATLAKNALDAEAASEVKKTAIAKMTASAIDGETLAHNRNATAAGSSAATSGRWGRFKGGAKNFLKGGGGAMMGTMALSVGGGLLGGMLQKGYEKPEVQEDGSVSGHGYDAGHMVGGALNTAAMGASIGMLFGPIGAAVGGAAGALVGLGTAFYEQSENIKKAELAKSIFDLDQKVKQAAAEFDAKIGSAVGGTYNAGSNKFEGEKDFNSIMGLIEGQAKSAVQPLQLKYNKLAEEDPESEEAKAALKQLQEAQVYATDTQAQYLKASALVAEDMRAKEQMAQANIERLRSGSEGAGRIGDIAKSNLDANTASKQYQEQASFLKQEGIEQDKLVKNAQRRIEMAKQQKEEAAKITDEGKRALAIAEAVKEEEYARGQLLSANAKKIESMNQALEKQMEARSVGADVAAKEAGVAKSLAEAEEALSSETRMGMGATYDAKVKSYQTTVNEVGALKEKVKAEQENLAMLQREARMSTDPVLKEQALAKVKAQTLKVQEAKVVAVQKETEAMQKLNQLRDSYINALEETSLGGLDMSINPTQDAGLVYFMTGPSGNYGHHLVGGGGNQRGIPGNTMASGATGNSWFTNNSGNPQARGAYGGVPQAPPGTLAQPVAGTAATTQGIPVFDSGGISNTPGYYYAGVPEAHVPLSSGAIPVRLSGGGGSTHVTVHGVCEGCRKSEIMSTANAANSSLTSKSMLFGVGASV